MLATSTIHSLLSIAAALPYGSPAQVARLAETAVVAAGHEVDLYALEEDHRVNLDHLVPWTGECGEPAQGLFDRVATIECEDGSFLLVNEGDAGIWIEWMASEAQDFRLLARGFWADHEPAEAVLFAREMWGC